jgi:hypothetical protein
MKNVLMRAILYLFCLFVLPVLIISDEMVQIQLPVRIAKSTKQIDDLKADDFSLYINGKQRRVIGCNKITRSIGQFPDLGRNFILSIHAPDYSLQVQHALSYFVTELLMPEDSLIFLTPRHYYQIKVSKNKEKIISEIEHILETDCFEYKNARAQLEKKLLARTEQLSQRLTSNEINNTNSISFSSIKSFLNVFSRDFFQYRNNYLVPDLKTYEKAISLLHRRDGERWWLHLQHGDVIPLLPRIKSINRRIRNNIDKAVCLGYAKAGSMLNHLLSNFEKTLALWDSFPKRTIEDLMINNNVTYNVILMDESKKSKARLISVSPELKVIFDEISSASGGKTVVTSNSEEGLRDIRSHIDYYYEIIYNFNGRNEDKTIQIKSSKLRSKQIYRSFFAKEEIQSLIAYYTREKITISDLMLEGGKIKFTVKAFKRQGKDKTGILKIRVTFIDDKKDTVYKKTNILRASKERVSISLPVPNRFKGQYTVIITACDKMANRFASEQTLIKL